MAIDTERLNTLLQAFVNRLPNEAASLNHRLLMRELHSADDVLPVRADDDSPGLLSIGADGGISVCRIDPGGTSIAHWGKLEGVTLEESFEVRLERTRLQAWTLRHPQFPRGGALTITTDGLPPDEQDEIGVVLRRLLD